MKRVLRILLGTIAFAVGYTMVGSYRYSAIVFSIVFLSLIFAVTYLLDKYLVPEFDTLYQIAKGNVAAAIYFLALCILAAAAVVAGSGGLGFLATP